MSFASTIVTGLTVNEIAPVGSIISYLGTSDINGWIICDGVARANTNGIYRRLFGMSIGTFTGATSGVGGTYTPPDLKGRFLYGTSTTTSVQTNAGSASQNVTLTTANLPAHNHTITDPGHKQ